MEKVINYLTGFFGGLMAVMMAIVPSNNFMVCINWRRRLGNGCYN